MSLQCCHGIVPWIRGLALAEQSQETGGSRIWLWVSTLASRGVRHSVSASALTPLTIAHFTDLDPETSGVKPPVQDYAAGSGSGPIFSDRKISCLLT